MNSTSYHCQDLDTYPPNYKHVCTNIDKEYPNLRMFVSFSILIETNLYILIREHCTRRIYTAVRRICVTMKVHM